MRGLICKDFFVMKKQLGYYLAFFVVYGVLAVTGVFPASILSALVAVIAMMVPMSSIAYDDQAHWGRYAAATPAGRSGVVAAKYLFTLLVLAACAVLVAVLAAILSLTGLLTEPLADLLAAVGACMGVAMRGKEPYHQHDLLHRHFRGLHAAGQAGPAAGRPAPAARLAGKRPARPAGDPGRGHFRALLLDRPGDLRKKGAVRERICTR